MLQEGCYALYKGTEYNVEKGKNNQVCIYTSNKELIDDTFIKSELPIEVYEKNIQYYDLEDAYRRSMCVVFEDGTELSVIAESRDRYLVSSGSEHKELIEEYQLKEVDRGVYEGWVNKNKIKILELKEDIKWLQEIRSNSLKAMR